VSAEPCGVQLFIPPQLDIKAPYCGLQRGHAGDHLFRIPEDILSSPGIIEAAGQPGDDPWKHRSKGMRCASCMWWVAKDAHGTALGTWPDAGRLGRCRRHAPTMAGFPAVFETDWCGDHKLDETKLGAGPR